MPRTATIQARIDPRIKNEAQKIFKTLNISMSEAISIYLTQVTLHRGIPFDVKIPPFQEQMEKAAAALLHDYENNDELTSFTVLDGEAFHETR